MPVFNQVSYMQSACHGGHEAKECRHRTDCLLDDEYLVNDDKAAGDDLIGGSTPVPVPNVVRCQLDSADRSSVSVLVQNLRQPKAESGSGRMHEYG